MIVSCSKTAITGLWNFEARADLSGVYAGFSPRLRSSSIRPGWNVGLFSGVNGDLPVQGTWAGNDFASILSDNMNKIYVTSYEATILGYDIDAFDKVGNKSIEFSGIGGGLSAGLDSSFSENVKFVNLPMTKYDSIFRALYDPTLSGRNELLIKEKMRSKDGIDYFEKTWYGFKKL